MQDIILNSENFSGNPILFLHGFPYDKRMWKYQLEGLASPVYSMDLLGSGFYKERTVFTLEDMADQVIEKVHNLNLKNPILAGLSMGGYVLLRVIEKFPNLFKGVILFDTRSQSDTNEVKIRRAELIQKIRKEGVKDFIRFFSPNTFAPKFLENPENYSFIVEEIGFSQTAEGLASQLLAMQGRTDTTNSLPKISIPTLVICGSKDTITTPEEMRTMKAKIPNSEFYIVEDAGHMSPVEKPGEVNEIIQKFLNTLI